MICFNCKKEITEDSRFCEFCGSKVNKSYKETIGDTDSNKRKHLHFLSNVALILSVFITATFLLSVSYDIDPDGGGFFMAIPITILVSFVYGKVAKKLDL